MQRIYRVRHVVTALLLLALIAIPATQIELPAAPATNTTTSQAKNGQKIVDILASLSVKGRAPKTGYARTQFGSGWATVYGCDTRNRILARDLTNVAVNEKCQVTSGILNDPYTGVVIEFVRGPDTSDKVQIDHVVALSNAWQTGAQQLTLEQREALANDPLNLLAVDGKANQNKSDGDAATWLPPHKAFRCQYVERQVKVKQKYHLWVTAPEKAAIERIITAC